ncbi:cilia- and flagella-associated protein 184-like [Genypterus blacodes]|uniref:cilia- and flagella-associated protein 184-like n=1 Tax=Genypterus blacodes TaxID=154954 RepID=UPI003F7713DD
MDVQPDQEEKELQNEEQAAVSADPANDEGASQVTDTNDGKEDVVSEKEQHDELPDCMEVTEEAPVEQKAAEDHCSDDLEAGETNTLIEQPLEGSIENPNVDGLLTVDPETQEREASQEEEQSDEESNAAAAPPLTEQSYEEQLKLLYRLYEDKEAVKPLSAQLHMKLVAYFKRGTGPSAKRNAPGLEQVYSNFLSTFKWLNQLFNANSETAQQQAAELRAQAQEVLDKVENEWIEYKAMKQDVAVMVQHAGKDAARAKVKSIQGLEQVQQDDLIQLRRKHIKLQMKIDRLKAELNAIDLAVNPHQKVEIQALYSPEGKRKNEKRHELSGKINKKMTSARQLLPKVKEKQDLTKTAVQTNKAQLAELEGQTVRKTGALTRIKHTCKKLHIDNLKLKDLCGMRGNRFLLMDFEDAVDDCEYLEKKMQRLKCRQAEIAEDVKEVYLQM